MFDTNNKRRHSHTPFPILLLIKGILNTNRQPILPRLLVLLTGVLVLTGFSGALQANPENTQIGHVGPKLYLNFSPNQSIALSNMIERTEVSEGQRGQRGYELDSDLALADTTTNKDLSAYFLPKITLTWNSVSPSKSLGRQLEGNSSGREGVKPTTLPLSSVDKLANNIDASSAESEDNSLNVEKPLVAEVVRSPFVTITLAGLALLGLVSVSRRNDL
ncbi:MAG: hypothetical protein KKE76_00310 [Gammaproteobacteria bacterium]|nr:hypothetical protein [Gammaproteobacteria bacterium]